MSRYFGSPGAGTPFNYSFLFNGQNGSGTVQVGLATSTNAGVTWTPNGGNPVLLVGGGGTWDHIQVHAPSVLWDGSQWVAYYGGYDNTNYRIGRATSADLVTWAKAGGNPLVNLGTAGAFDDNGLNFPTVRYDTSVSPHWQMWYTGFKSGGNTTIGYADSTDGLTWTKRGQVLAEGTSGDFDDTGLATGPVYFNGTTYYVQYAGYDGAHYHSGYATCTSPTGTYTKQGVLTTFSGNITSLTDGLTYQSNQLRTIVLRGPTYIGYGSAFAPVSPATQHEVSFRSTSADLVTWTTPTGPLIAVGSGWDSISAENPSVVAS